jgi:hypothetical protein
LSESIVQVVVMVVGIDACLGQSGEVIEHFAYLCGVEITGVIEDLQFPVDAFCLGGPALRSIHLHGLLPGRARLVASAESGVWADQPVRDACLCVVVADTAVQGDGAPVVVDGLVVLVGGVGDGTQAG